VRSARLVVLDPAGLHARPAAQFVRIACRFTSRVSIRTGGRSADAKSLIALLALGIRPGAEITIEGDGPDEAEAVNALVEDLGATVERVGDEPDGSSGFDD
jgi:phosphotransferase system HPr (HPr) family protein